MTQLGIGVRCAVCESLLVKCMRSESQMQSASFEVRPEDGGAARHLGPFRLYKGETAELVVTPRLELARVDIHRSVP